MNMFYLLLAQEPGQSVAPPESPSGSRSPPPPHLAPACFAAPPWEQVAPLFPPAPREPRPLHPVGPLQNAAAAAGPARTCRWQKEETHNPQLDGFKLRRLRLRRSKINWGF